MSCPVMYLCKKHKLAQSTSDTTAVKINLPYDLHFHDFRIWPLYDGQLVTLPSNVATLNSYKHDMVGKTQPLNLFMSSQVNFIYIAPNHNRSCLVTL